MVRLDKRVSLGSGAPRKPARIMCMAGRVTLNGHVVKNPATQVEDDDVVALDGEVLAGPEPIYLAMHKPAGRVCTHGNDHHPDVFELLTPSLRKRLQAVGRLDLDATGLLLFTDDGQWSHRVASAKACCPKTYRVTLVEALQGDAAALLEAGVKLRGEKKLAHAQLVQHDELTVDLTVSEGRYHLVKRIAGALGSRVVTLHRWRIGDLELGDLPEGEVRMLTPEEVDGLARRG